MSNIQINMLNNKDAWNYVKDSTASTAINIKSKYNQEQQKVINKAAKKIQRLINNVAFTQDYLEKITILLNKNGIYADDADHLICDLVVLSRHHNAISSWFDSVTNSMQRFLDSGGINLANRHIAEANINILVVAQIKYTIARIYEDPKLYKESANLFLDFLEREKAGYIEIENMTIDGFLKHFTKTIKELKHCVYLNHEKFKQQYLKIDQMKKDCQDDIDKLGSFDKNLTKTLQDNLDSTIVYLKHSAQVATCANAEN